jgi:two-component system sensor histidine kinase ArlS
MEYPMNGSSIRLRLPMSYAGIALLTTFVLGGVLLFTLTNFYTQQELGYLKNSAELMAPGLSKLLESNPSSPSLNLYMQNLSFLIQARIRLLDPEDEVLVDSGALQSQQFIYTNLTPSGMSADVFREGRAERYLFNVGINIIEDAPEMVDLGGSPVILSQLPTENTLCGFGLGSGSTKSLQHTDQVVRYPLTGSTGQPLGTIEISEGLAFGSKIIKRVARFWAYAGLVAVLVAAGVGWWGSRRLVAPLMVLTETTQIMASGDLSAQAQVTTKDEFGVLSRSFNTMARRIEEMVATLRSFVADAAHELHTPLTTLRINLDLAADDPANLDDYLPPARNQVARMEALVDSLLDLSRIESNTGVQTRFSLSALVEECAEKYQSRAEQAGLSFGLQLTPEEVQLYGDEAQIRRALENLLDNALKFTPAGGLVELILDASPQGISISVQDSGIGIPPDDLPKLFQRFHRGRNAVSYPGSGLGLAIVKTIVDRHLGVVEVESDTGGTVVKMRFKSS